MNLGWFSFAILIGSIIGFLVYRVLYVRKIDELRSTVIDQINNRYKDQINKLKIVNEKPLTHDEILKELNHPSDN